MKIQMKFWRCRFALETPWGHSASFTAGAHGIESVEYDSDTGMVIVNHERQGSLVIGGGDGFGHFVRDDKPAKRKKEAPSNESDAPPLPPLPPARGAA